MLEVCIKLAHQPEMPVKLQFNKNMAVPLVAALTAQALSNIIASYEQSPRSVRLTDQSDHRVLDVLALRLPDRQRVNLLLDLRLDEHETHHESIKHTQPKKNLPSQQDVEFYSCNDQNDDKFYDCQEVVSNQVGAGGLQEVESITKVVAHKHYLFCSGQMDLQTQQGDYQLGRTKGIFSYLPEQAVVGLCAPALDISRDALLKGLVITSGGDIKIVDPEVIAKFKGFMSEMIKKISQSIAEGRGIIGVSLPIRIFEPRSTIERITDAWGYAVHFLSRLDTTADLSMKAKVHNVEQVMLFAGAGLSLSLSMMKPFNPLLGETYQGTFSDGGVLSIEHVSHHPPISVFMLDHPDYIFKGYYEYKASNSATFNQITLIYHGPNTVILKKSGQTIKYNMPEIRVGGMIWGDRLTRYRKYMVFDDAANKIKAVLNFGVEKQEGKTKLSTKRADSVYGKIYSYKEAKKKLKEDEVLKMVDLVEEHHVVTGSYMEAFYVDGQQKWNMSTDRPEMVTPLENPLPSDWRYREDLIWLHYQQSGHSEKWKLKLEEEQRRHRKLRAQGKKKNK